MKIELKTSLNTYDKLHRLADKRGETVSISRQELLNLLIDHSNLVSIIRETRSAQIIEPKQRDRLIPYKEK